MKSSHFAVLLTALAASGCTFHVQAERVTVPAVVLEPEKQPVADDHDDDEIEALLKVLPRTDREILETARHEAGHAVVRAFLFGPEEIAYMKVYPQKTDDGTGGVTVSRKRQAFYTAEEIRRDCADSYGGRVADELLNRGADTGSTSDIKYVAAAFKRLHLQNGLGSNRMYRENEDATDEDKAAIAKDVADAYACAHSVVSANTAMVEDLARLVLAQPLKKNVHLLRGDDLRAFIAKVPFNDPGVDADPEHPLPAYCAPAPGTQVHLQRSVEETTGDAPLNN